MKEKEIFAVMIIGNQTPSVTYDNCMDAQNEAVRLVKKERKPAYVLKAVAYVELSDVVITRFDV